MTRPALALGSWLERLNRLTARLTAAVGLLRPSMREEVEPAPRTRPYPWEAAYPEGLDWSLHIEPRSMPELFDRSVKAFEENPCLEFMGKRITYREIGDLVCKTAWGFRELGVEKGVKVGLFLPNCPYFIICYYAILKAGGIVVNFNPLYAERGVARQIRDSRVQIMVTMDLGSLYPKIGDRLDDTDLETVVVCSMRSALPFPASALFALLKRKEMSAIPSDDDHVRFEKLISNDGELEAARPDPDDVALLQYTGGTTGLPKGAMLTHGNLYANTLQTAAWAPDIEPGSEKILGVLPLFHAFGMTGVMNVGLHIGAEIVLLPRFKVAEALKVIEKDRPSILLGVPTMFSAINSHKHAAKYDLSSLKICISGGAPLPLEVKTVFEELSGCVLVEGYGLTEAGPICTINPIDGLNKPGSAGLPIPGTVIEVVSLDDPGRAVPIGDKGEVCVSGPQVMAGYLNQEDETAAVLRDGRLHTGDVGYMDEDGYLFLIDRIKDLIITGGFNVYPRMVEDAVLTHPSVEDVAVCGAPSAHHGEIVKAFVVLREGEKLTASELRGFLKDKLASFEMPRRIEFTDEIPKTLLGKPLRRELVAREQRRNVTGDDETEEALT